MPLPTLLQRSGSVNLLLTEIIQGYEQPELSGFHLLPKTLCMSRNASIIKFDKNLAFTKYQTRRAPGAEIAKRNSNYTTTPIKLHQEALAGEITIEGLESAQSVGLDLQQEAVLGTMDSILLSVESEQAAVLTNTANYDPSHVEAALTNKWDDFVNSTPIVDVDNWRSVVRSDCGHYPNRAIIGAKLFDTVKNHPQVLDRIKHTSRDSITVDMVGAIFNFAPGELKLGESIKDNGSGVLEDIWGDRLIMGYVAPVPEGSDRSQYNYRLSFGHTLELRGMPIAETPVYEPLNRTWYFPVIYDYYPNISSADCGFLATDLLT